MAVIDNMRRLEPDSAWDLMASLLPRSHDSQMRSGRPDWRDWAPEEDLRVTHPMIAVHADEMIRRMLEDAGEFGERWTTLIEALDDVPLKSHNAIVARLADMAASAADLGFRTTIWNTLREFVSKHRSFADADWSVGEAHIDAVARVLDQFEPQDPVSRYGFLFSHRPALPEGREDNFEEHDRIVSLRRVEAAEVWYRALGFRPLLECCALLERPDALGDALATSGAVTASDEPVLLELALDSTEPRARSFGRAYLARCSRIGRASVASLLDGHGASWSARAQAEALLSMPLASDILSLVDRLEAEGRSYYWSNVAVYWIDDTLVGRALEELIKCGRPHAAVDLAALHLKRTPSLAPADVQRALSEAATVARDITGYRSQAYDVSELIAFLEDAVASGRTGADEVVRLELLYLPTLRHDFEPVLLHKSLADRPRLFVEAVCLAYRGESEPERELDDGGLARARLAQALLSSWHRPPGMVGTVVDSSKLDAWVTEARELLGQQNRQAIGDRLIGQVLAGSPPGADGAWPTEPVRDLIERLRSDDLESGLHIGRFNQRGVVSKSPLAGGNAERSLKLRYERDAALVAARWPRTAAFLRSFASSYARDAAREDADAQLRHDLDF
jgi:hypothetical protein